jgi:glucose-6-phosphate 1-dehydrogenase
MTIRTLLLLGATGDLSRRFLLPAVGTLIHTRRLPEGFRVVGAARDALPEEDARRLAGELGSAFFYRSVDLADPSSLAAVLDGQEGPVAVYLALPPAVFATTIASLGEVGLETGSRVAVEKPFGDDVDEARELNALLARTDLDGYRVDHVLGMETVRNLIALRRRPLLERLWNGERVEHVEILWEETLALEGRAGYYDHAGALKDVLQSHMLQLLALVGMEGEGDIHGRKLDVLRAVRITSSRRARYTRGTLADGRVVPAYVEEEGVDPGRCTETFVELTLELDGERWSGTQFVLRAGKALARRRKLVLLRFRSGGELEIGIDGPEDIVLRLDGAAESPLELRGTASGDGLPPYAHVLLDILGGTNGLSVGGDEAEEAWRAVEPVLEAWDAGAAPLEEYPAGSAGIGHAFTTTYPTKAP